MTNSNSSIWWVPAIITNFDRIVFKKNDNVVVATNAEPAKIVESSHILDVMVGATDAAGGDEVPYAFWDISTLLVNRFILITIGCQFRTPMGWGCCCWPDDSKNLSMERLWRVVLLSFISTWRWTNKTCSSWTSSNTGGACFSMSSWRDWHRDNLIWWRRCTCDNGRPTSWPLRCTDDDAQMLPDVLVFL